MCTLWWYISSRVPPLFSLQGFQQGYTAQSTPVYIHEIKHASTVLLSDVFTQIKSLDNKKKIKLIVGQYIYSGVNSDNDNDSDRVSNSDSDLYIDQASGSDNIRFINGDSDIGN